MDIIHDVYMSILIYIYMLYGYIVISCYINIHITYPLSNAYEYYEYNRQSILEGKSMML